MPEIPHDLHEGSWLYVSAGVQPLDRVLAVCRGNGWPVIVGSEEMVPQRRAEAVRLADACIVDISASSPDVEEELSLARDRQRPLIALRRSGRAAAAIEADRSDVRELSFDDGEEGLRALDRLLVDPDWERQVALAAPADHA